LLDVDVCHGASYALVSEYLHNVDDVFGFVVFYGSLPMSKSVKVYFIESCVIEFYGCSAS